MKDLELIKIIKTFFKEVGSINISGNSVHYKVRSRKDLLIIIEHFNKYPLCTSKFINFFYFSKVYDLIGHKFQTNVNGFLQLVSIINKLNRPLSPSLIESLSTLGALPAVNFEPPIISNNPSLNPFLISGFITGEGSFTYFTRVRNNSKNEKVRDFTLVMEVSQDNKDGYILISIQKYFQGIGKVYQSLSKVSNHGVGKVKGITRYRLVVKEEIIDKLVPHFIDYPLGGNKLLQYNIWLKIVKILIENPTRSPERDNIISNLIKDLSNL